VNNDNEEKISKGLLGTGTQMPSPSQPLLLLEDARTLLQKRKLCPKNLCHERGSPQVFAQVGVSRQTINSVERARIIRTCGWPS